MVHQAYVIFFYLFIIYLQKYCISKQNQWNMPQHTAPPYGYDLFVCVCGSGSTHSVRSRRGSQRLNMNRRVQTGKRARAHKKKMIVEFT